MLLASIGIASSLGGSRPSHPLTDSTLAPSFLREWHPDSAGVRVADHVATLAAENARTSEAAGVEIAEATGVASTVLDDARTSRPGFFVPSEAFFRRAGELPPPVVGRASARFGPRERRGSATADRHTGYSYSVDPGTEVRVIAPGFVSFVGPVRGLGLVVIVDHGDEYHSVYAHLLDGAVEEGDLVAAEQAVGSGGSRATSGRTEVYFEIRDRGVPVNPAEWLR